VKKNWFGEWENVTKITEIEKNLNEYTEALKKGVCLRAAYPQSVMLTKQHPAEAFPLVTIIISEIL